MTEFKAQDQIELEQLKTLAKLADADPDNVEILEEIIFRLEQRAKELEIRDLLKKESAAFPAEGKSLAKSTDDAMVAEQQAGGSTEERAKENAKRRARAKAKRTKNHSEASAEPKS